LITLGFRDFPLWENLQQGAGALDLGVTALSEDRGAESRPLSPRSAIARSRAWGRGGSVCADCETAIELLLSAFAI
jgi:hypothetical protein